MSEPEGLTIRDVVERTGVAAVTLRMWENRYGFPEPNRRASGHRRYSEAEVEALLQVVRDRDLGLSLRVAIERARGASAAPDLSMYAGLRRRHAELMPWLLPKTTLVAISHAMEDECHAHAERPLIFASFQEESQYRQAERRYQAFTACADLAIVFSDFRKRRDPPDGPVELPVERDLPFAVEWTLICDAPNYAACMAGRERPGQSATSDDQRLFETIWTIEPGVVRDGSRIAASLARGTAPELVESVAERLESPAAGPADPLRSAVELTNRIVAYAGAPGARPERAPRPPSAA